MRKSTMTAVAALMLAGLERLHGKRAQGACTEVWAFLVQALEDQVSRCCLNFA